jgi:hypothetical protein
MSCINLCLVPAMVLSKWPHLNRQEGRECNLGDFDFPVCQVSGR